MKKNKIVISIVSVIIILIFSVIFSIINIFNSNIIKGIKIKNMDMCKYTKEEAINELNKITEKQKNKEIILKYNDKENRLLISDFDVKYKIQDLVNEMFLVGRQSNIFINNFTIIKTIICGKEFSIDKEFNEDVLDNKISNIVENLPGVVEEYSYYIEDNNLIITSGKEGIDVNKDKLKDEIINFFDDFDKGKIVIDIPTEEKKPEEINIDKIHKEIYKEVQDAYVSENPTVVHPNVNGVNFSIEEAKEQIKQKKEEYVIPLEITIASKTLADLGKNAFPNELGAFFTKYDVSNENRTNNIQLASDKINGTVIMPGETFSYNKTVGKRTIESGYKEAGAYAGGQIVQEVGGGICQVSTTLYNAVLYANLDVVERYNHYFECSYVEAGRDATVSWGTLDFKFKNNKSYPIKIVSSSKNGVENISIMGIKEDDKEVIIQAKRTSTIERKIVYEKDDTIEKNQEIIKQSGHDGCTSETYIIIREKDEIIFNKLISKDYYHSLDRIIRIGTK